MHSQTFLDFNPCAHLAHVANPTVSARDGSESKRVTQKANCHVLKNQNETEVNSNSTPLPGFLTPGLIFRFQYFHDFARRWPCPPWSSTTPGDWSCRRGCCPCLIFVDTFSFICHLFFLFAVHTPQILHRLQHTPRTVLLRPPRLYLFHVDVAIMVLVNDLEYLLVPLSFLLKYCNNGSRCCVRKYLQPIDFKWSR